MLSFSFRTVAERVNPPEKPVRFPSGEYTFGYGFYFLYRVECVRVEILDDPDHMREILPFYDGENHLDLTGTCLLYTSDAADE